MIELKRLNEKNPDLFFHILESIKDAIFITDHEGKTLWLNSASEEMCGVPRSEILNRNVRELEKEGLFNPSVLRMALDENKNVSTVQTVSKGRKYIATGHLVRDERGNVIVGVAHLRDITDAVHNTTKLQEVEELLEEYSKQIRKLISTRTESEKNIFETDQIHLIPEQMLRKIASVDTTVLIEGGTGTGKTLTAKQIHLLSDRKNGPFVQINCAALPDSLFESELFGYEKGSFTGATSKGKAGLIKTAESGTLFLDEIGEIPLHLQSKLLHFLQSKTYLPIGARNLESSDIRIIAATNRNLEEMVEEGKFRSDLYYRMNVLKVSIPPLRESKNKIERFAHHFLAKFNEQYQTNKRFSDEVLDRFLAYSWPGNIRELENLIERLVILSDKEYIEAKDLPQKMIEQDREVNTPYLTSDTTMPEVLEEMEKQMIIDALKKEKSTRKAAERLGVTQSLLMRRLKKYNIKLIVEKGEPIIRERS